MKLYNSVDPYICPICGSMHGLSSSFFHIYTSKEYENRLSTTYSSTPNLFKCRTCNFISYVNELIFDPRYSSPRTIPHEYSWCGEIDFTNRNFTRFFDWDIPSHDELMSIVKTGIYECELPEKAYSFPYHLVEADDIISKYHAGSYVREPFHKDISLSGNVITRNFSYESRKFIFAYFENKYETSIKEINSELVRVKDKIDNKSALNPFMEDGYQEYLIEGPKRIEKLIKQQEELRTINF